MSTEASQTIHAIALKTVKYNDRYNILWLYTRECGRRNVLVTAGTGRSAATTRALTQPLSLIELTAHNTKGGMARASGLKAQAVLHSLMVDPIKITIAMFLAELLTISLLEGDAEPQLYDYIERSVMQLDRSRHSVANFHLAFMLGLSRWLGIGPDYTTYGKGRVFDMSDAMFRDSIPLHTPHWLNSDDSSTLMALSRMTTANCHIYRFTRNERAEILDQLMRYFSIHYRSMSSLRSLEVLRSL